MDKAVVTLLIRSFRGGQETIAHYLYALSYYIIAVTGGGRTEISFIPFQGRIQRSVAITYPFKEQPDSTRQIHGRSRWYSLQSAFSQEKKVQNQIFLNTKRDRLHFCKRSLIVRLSLTNWHWFFATLVQINPKPVNLHRYMDESIPAIQKNLQKSRMCAALQEPWESCVLRWTPCSGLSF